MTSLEKHLRTFTVNAACVYFLLTLFQGVNQPMREEKERARHNWLQWADDHEVGKKWNRGR